ncbi:hypothetical protein E2C01_089290 [Portunus trituberculatus]|uniref:Cadherin domain-containing protein n=1 Tax=Portunus trituberculatus TaxID=210409 RepID=A0A5B7JLU8_PORTR|nr:hypothetical protein [Portunus trituberculatus]
MLEVTVADGEQGDPTTLSSTTYIIVKVQDENDHAPKFLERLYKFFVPVVPHRESPAEGEYVEDMPIGQVRSER